MLLRGLLTGKIQPSRLLNERIFSCLLCGACTGKCPLGVDIPAAIYYGRALLEKTDKKRGFMRAFLRLSMKWPDLAFSLARMSQHFLVPALAKLGIIPFSHALPEIPLRRLEQVFKVQKKRGRVAVFTGCSVNYIFPSLGESLINLLQQLGYEVVLPKGEVCCGALLRSLGLEDEAVLQAKKNYQVFSRLKVEAILSLCPTCTMNLKFDYPKMIGKGLEKAMDISAFFRDKVEITGGIGKTAFFHDPCHLRYSLGMQEEPRELIQKAGIELIESRDSGCCGFAGLYCFYYRDRSRSLLQRQTKNIIDSRADTVITSCPGCILQLSQTVTDRPVLHLVEILEEAYCYRQADKKSVLKAQMERVGEKP